MSSRPTSAGHITTHKLDHGTCTHSHFSQIHATHPHAPPRISIHDDNMLSESSNPRSTTTTTYTTQCNPLWVTGPLLAINGWFLFQHSGPTGPAPSPQALLPAGPALSFTHSSPASRAPPPTAQRPPLLPATCNQTGLLHAQQTSLASLRRHLS